MIPGGLEEAFASWTESLAERVRGVVAVDGKTLRGSKQDASGTGALHLASAFAHDAGLILAQRAVDGRSNEITAIPDLLDMLVLEGAIVTIDAMGTQKEIAARIVAKKADYVLALKGNQGALKDDAALFFADPALTADCPCHKETASGHGRIEERIVRAAAATWLAQRHPEWKGLARIAAVTNHRTNKITGQTTTETRLYISSLPPEHASARPHKALPQAQAPQGRHEPKLSRDRPRRLTIDDFALAKALSIIGRSPRLRNGPGMDGTRCRAELPGGRGG